MSEIRLVGGGTTHETLHWLPCKAGASSSTADVPRFFEPVPLECKSFAVTAGHNIGQFRTDAMASATGEGEAGCSKLYEANLRGRQLRGQSSRPLPSCNTPVPHASHNLHRSVPPQG